METLTSCTKEDTKEQTKSLKRREEDLVITLYLYLLSNEDNALLSEFKGFDIIFHINETLIIPL